MNYNSKRINVLPGNVKLYYDNNIELSLQPFVNKIIEKFFNGELIEVSNKNKKQVQEIASKLDCNNTEAVNHIFNNYQFIIDETPKQKIKLDKIRHKTKLRRNDITDY